MTNKKVKVALGLSGGVDSAVCAQLLVDQGYDVAAVFIECWNEPGCRTDQDHRDALQIALELKIPFKVLDFRKQYREKVMNYFLSEYKAGRTPNPDAMCNCEIKFGLFYEWAMGEGFDAIATGHYAKIVEINGSKRLAVPKDTHKDQTYFLHLLRGEQLEKIIFPLAELTKVEVRQKANEWGIAVADKKDSVGICFVGDINVHDFLKSKLGENPGDVVDTDGNVIGSHQGLWFYTIGQRGGFTVFPTQIIKTKTGETLTKHNIPPFYVIGKKVKENQLVVGFGAQTQQHQFEITDLHMIDPKQQLENISNLFVRIRHTGELLDCKVTPTSDQQYSATLETAISGIAPGQSAVLYQKINNVTLCLGGGIITI